jgi:phospholipase C
MPPRSRRYWIAGAATALLATSCTGATQSAGPEGLKKIDHIVVVYLENRSFDNLYGLFPGANGLAQADGAAAQVDKDGKAYTVLPAVMNTNKKPAVVDDRFPQESRTQDRAAVQVSAG